MPRSGWLPTLKPNAEGAAFPLRWRLAASRLVKVCRFGLMTLGPLRAPSEGIRMRHFVQSYGAVRGTEADLLLTEFGDVNQEQF